jgi:hypothetical protein
MVEPDGRSHQYFYYLLYIGHLQQRMSDIATDHHCKRRVVRIARGYYKGCLMLARDN